MKHLLLSAAMVATIHLHAQTVTQYRYWINDDPTTLTTTSVTPGVAFELNATLDLPALAKDYNTITVQFQDNNGEYSVPHTIYFTKNSGEVNGYEYWIDDAIVNRNTGTLGPNTIADLVADLPTTTTSGDHLFTIRFSSTNGTWSAPLTSEYYFFTGIDELPGISDLLLFPNPASNDLGLRLSTVEARTLNLQVLDISGAVVRDLSTWSVVGTTSHNWDISDLASGSYMLRISDESNSSTIRFVKP
jgi:hypothetical protein